MQCPSCSAEVPSGSRRCGTCGGALPEQDTKVFAQATTAHDAGSDLAGESQFLPGVVLGRRYRVVNLLGRGGMGEVYRADDLKLGQPVALKFLPPEGGGDRSRLDHLMEEVRLARSISHANVCRVFDIGEIDGQHFISMELVDGEDLASLLRRIGRLPEDKALQIARQLCAGLAAAHEEGILHRDLKPANVMLDGRGRAKIMDFGLAALDERVAGGTRVGTPAYMAPEQRAGRKATVRSDLYSLGLVLYELFTGRRAFEHERPPGSTPPEPSSHVEGMDPAMERVILSCLEEDPVRRPASALAVAAALPGGDPLAEALLMGQTPPPDIVAAAGGEGALSPRVAVSCLIAALALLAAVPFLHQQRSLPGLSPLPHPPEVLVTKAREIVEQLGYSEPPLDEAHLFLTRSEFLEHVRAQDSSPSRWDRLATGRPTPIGFWYRRSPRHLTPWQMTNHVLFEDPPVRTPGMINVTLESTGELRSLWVVPPARVEDSESTEEPDWEALFKLAGLHLESFASVTPVVTPRVFCDLHAAWEGHYPGQEDPAIRVEACALRGRPVEFRIVHPWSRPRGASAPSSGRAGRLAYYSLFITLVLTAAVMARRNLRMGRGDRRGAVRVALFLVVTTMVGWTLTFNHVPRLDQQLFSFIGGLGLALFLGLSLWLFYLAMEPPVRRLWPQLLVSWSRVLVGRFRDPLVGAHVLLGALLGLVGGAVEYGHHLAARQLGYPPDIPDGLPAEQLHSPGWFLGAHIQDLGQSILLNTMMDLFLLVFLYFVLRRRWLATMGFVSMLAVVSLIGTENPLLALPFLLATGGLLALAFLRFGLVGGLAMTATFQLSWNSFLLTSNSSAWYFGYSLTTLVALGTLIFYSFWVSLGGQSALGDPRRLSAAGFE